jgi:hypothetical protein
MRATVVTLEPSVEIEGVSFETAFGETSELRGRGRAKRQKRRQERRMKRIADRRERKKAKQEMRSEQQEARQKRKDIRKQRKVARKGMGEEEEEESTETGGSSESQPAESQPTETESSTNDSSSQETAPEESETSESEQADELGDNEDVAEDESSFDAETTGEESSFDVENYDTEMSNFAAKNANLSMEIKKTMHRINVLKAYIKRTKTILQSGKVPSNKVAIHAKNLKMFNDKLSRQQAKLSRLNQMAQKQSKLIPVKSTLGAKLQPNKIVVPAKGFDGEGTGMDDDFNNADGDDMSSFDGKAFLSKNKGLLIGLGIGVVAVLVLNKMKVLK